VVIPRRISLGFIAAASLFWSACSSTRTFVVLLPEDSGAATAVTVGEGRQSTVLDAPLTAAKVGARGQIETTIVTTAEVDRTFGEAIAAKPPRTMSFTLHFYFDSTVIAPESQSDLDALFAEVAKREAVEVQVTGHTDLVGSETYNDRLSLERAQAVAKMLMDRGLKATFIRAVGRGKREPLVPTLEGAAEPRNRRAEVILR
jgi:outer membrane protein OmpA-like peptidoglycan-associated protein